MTYHLPHDAREMETEILLENRELFEKRPDCWEFILTVDRLERPLEEIIRAAGAVVPVPSSPHASAFAGADVMQKNLSVISTSLQALCPLTESRLIESWGPLGQQGIAAEIEHVCGEIISRCNDLAGAEHAILTTPMHPRLADAQRKFQGLASENLSSLLRVIKSIRRFLAAGSSGELNLEVHFTTERLAGIKVPDASFVEQVIEATRPGNECLLAQAVMGCVLGYYFWWAIIPAWIFRRIFFGQKPSV